MFTKQHYEVIAKVIIQLESARLRTRVSKLFSWELSKDNPNFDQARFERYCGVPVTWLYKEWKSDVSPKV